MDPDAALEAIRELRAELFANGEPYDPATVRALAEHVDALDSWLAGGGFAPAAWRSK